MGDKKKLVFRYGVYWEYEPIPRCPKCEYLLTYKYEDDAHFYRKVFCDHCKKTSLIYDDEGNDITMKKAIELMKAKFSNRMEDGCRKGESEDRNEILSRINSLQHDVDYLKHKIGAIDAVSPKLNALYDLIEYNETFLLDKLNKILRILGEKR